MANTGYKQAVIAYKVRKSDGAALDINGQPLLINGLPNPASTGKQAIYILVGTTNPNTALYDVVGTFPADGSVTGNTTIQYSADCLAGFISITAAATVVMDPSIPSLTFTLKSSHNWALTSTIPLGAGSTPIVTITPVAGARGEYTIVLTRTSDVGQGYVTFTNLVTGQTAQFYLVNVASTARPWILATHAWNMLGFWDNAATWGA